MNCEGRWGMRRKGVTTALYILMICILLVCLCFSVKKSKEKEQKLPWMVQVVDITNERTTTYQGNPVIKDDTLYIYDARQIWSTSHTGMVE